MRLNMAVNSWKQDHHFSSSSCPIQPTCISLALSIIDPMISFSRRRVQYKATTRANWMRRLFSQRADKGKSNYCSLIHLSVGQKRNKFLLLDIHLVSLQRKFLSSCLPSQRKVEKMISFAVSRARWNFTVSTKKKKKSRKLTRHEKITPTMSTTNHHSWTETLTHPYPTHLRRSGRFPLNFSYLSHGTFASHHSCALDRDRWLSSRTCQCWLSADH